MSVSLSDIFSHVSVRHKEIGILEEGFNIYVKYVCHLIVCHNSDERQVFVEWQWFLSIVIGWLIAATGVII